jgi:hypothetical protein
MMIRFVLPDLTRLEKCGADAVVLFRFSEKVPFRGIGSLIDWRLHGHLSRITIENFFTGATDTPLLMPPGRYLPQRFLLLMGLGEQGAFSRTVFEQSLGRSFEVLKNLKIENTAMALPGRVEKVCPSGDAIDWFINVVDHRDDIGETHIIEHAGAQKTMLAAVEKWRLRGLVPEL